MIDNKTCKICGKDLKFMPSKNYYSFYCWRIDVMSKRCYSSNPGDYHHDFEPRETGLVCLNCGINIKFGSISNIGNNE